MEIFNNIVTIIKNLIITIKKKKRRDTFEAAEENDE